MRDKRQELTFPRAARVLASVWVLGASLVTATETAYTNPTDSSIVAYIGTSNGNVRINQGGVDEYTAAELGMNGGEWSNDGHYFAFRSGFDSSGCPDTSKDSNCGVVTVVDTTSWAVAFQKHGDGNSDGLGMHGGDWSPDDDWYAVRTATYNTDCPNNSFNCGSVMLISTSTWTVAHHFMGQAALDSLGADGGSWSPDSRFYAVLTEGYESGCPNANWSDYYAGDCGAVHIFHAASGASLQSDGSCVAASSSGATRVEAENAWAVDLDVTGGISWSDDQAPAIGGVEGAAPDASCPASSGANGGGGTDGESLAPTTVETSTPSDESVALTTLVVRSGTAFIVEAGATVLLGEPVDSNY